MDEFEVLERMGVEVKEVDTLRCIAAYVRPHRIGLVRTGLSPAEHRLAGELLLEAALRHLGDQPAA